MVILRSQHKITDFLKILAWVCPFKLGIKINFWLIISEADI